MQALLQDRIREAQQLLQRVDKLCLQQKVEGKAKLCSKLRAELNFLTKVEAGAVVIKESHLHSTNLTHLKAIVESAESLESVVALLHVFAYEDSGGTRHTLVVDVVANKGHTWVKAIGRKAEALHNIWQGRGQYGDKSVVHQAEDFLLASRQQPVLYSQPSVVFAFYNGISKPMADQLTQMGVSVRGDIVAVNVLEEEEEEEEVEEVEEEEEEEEGEGGGGAEGLMGMEAPQDTACEGEGGGEQEEESELNHTCVDRHTVVASLAFPTLQVEECVRVNLDITTLITLVSSLSHGHCRLAFREPVLTEQAAQERQQPVLPGLHAFLQDKELFACSAAVADFQSILETLGGPGEKKRAQELLGRVALVEDQPSPRTLRLAVSSKVNRRSLMIFGTGDTLQAVTTTANSGFVRAAANQGVRFSVFIHQPRALTEAKEWRATPTGP